MNFGTYSLNVMFGACVGGAACTDCRTNSARSSSASSFVRACLVAALTALVVVVSFAIIAAQLLVALVESFIVIGAGILFVGFSGARWTKFFTERYLSYVASVGVKLFVLYLIMGVGTSIAARWVSVLDRGGFSPIPFFYVMGGSLVSLFLTWHIPSVAAAMMVGKVHLSLADVHHPAMLAGRGGAVGLAAAGALFALGRWSHGKVREWAALHTGGSGGADGAGGAGAPPFRPGGSPPGSFVGPAAEASRVGATNDTRAEAAPVTAARGTAPSGSSPSGRGQPSDEPRTPPNTPGSLSGQTSR